MHKQAIRSPYIHLTRMEKRKRESSLVLFMRARTSTTQFHNSWALICAHIQNDTIRQVQYCERFFPTLFLSHSFSLTHQISLPLPLWVCVVLRVAYLDIIVIIVIMCCFRNIIIAPVFLLFIIASSDAHKTSHLILIVYVIVVRLSYHRRPQVGFFFLLLLLLPFVEMCKSKNRLNNDNITITTTKYTHNGKKNLNLSIFPFCNQCHTAFPNFSLYVWTSALFLVIIYFSRSYNFHRKCVPNSAGTGGKKKVEWNGKGGIQAASNSMWNWDIAAVR